MSALRVTVTGATGLIGSALLAALRERDALRGRAVRWSGGEGTGAGIDDDGRLLVARADGTRTALDAGEVHLLQAPGTGAPQ